MAHFHGPSGSGGETSLIRDSLQFVGPCAGETPGPRLAEMIDGTRTHPSLGGPSAAFAILFVQGQTDYACALR